MTHSKGQLSEHEYYLKYQDYYRNYRKIHAKEKRLKSRQYHHKMKIKLLNFLGGKCVRCGFSDFRALQIDHVNGGGVKERKSITKMFSKYIFEKIQQGNKEYQLLCANCNWIKRAENNENNLNGRNGKKGV